MAVVMYFKLVIEWGYKMSKYQLRTKALETLVRVGDRGAFSHLMIDQTLQKTDWSRKDESLFTELVYDALKYKLSVSYFLEHLVDRARKVDSWVKWRLYLSFSQIHYSA